jgi:hypothetical protein
MKQQQTGRVASPCLAIEQVYPIYFDCLMPGLLHVKHVTSSFF